MLHVKALFRILSPRSGTIPAHTLPTNNLSRNWYLLSTYNDDFQRFLRHLSRGIRKTFCKVFFMQRISAPRPDPISEIETNAYCIQGSLDPHNCRKLVYNATRHKKCHWKLTWNFWIQLACRDVNSGLEQRVVEILDPFGPSIVDPRLGMGPIRRAMCCKSGSARVDAILRIRIFIQALLNPIYKTISFSRNPKPPSEPALDSHESENLDPDNNILCLNLG